MRAPFQIICGSRSRSRSRVTPLSSGVLRANRTGFAGSSSSSRSATDASSAVARFLRVASSWVSVSTCFAPFAAFFFFPAISSSLHFLGAHFANEPAECRFDLEDISELFECPAAERGEVVNTRHPERAHGLCLELRAAAAIALGLQDQV